MSNKTKFRSFIKGKVIDLIIVDENFVKNTDWFEWINHNINTEFLTVGNYPNTLTHQKKYFKEQILSNKRLQLGVFCKRLKKLVGLISLYSINMTNKDAFISVFFDKRWKLANSLSIFVEAHNLIISHGFKKMNLRRVLSTTISKELDDLLCKVLNFKKEGLIKKKVYKNNKYHDLYISSILK